MAENGEFRGRLKRGDYESGYLRLRFRNHKEIGRRFASCEIPNDQELAAELLSRTSSRLFSFVTDEGLELKLAPPTSADLYADRLRFVSSGAIPGIVE